MADPSKSSVGYLLSFSVADNVFMGGAMVTDCYGLPIEFRYTEPVRATRLQRVLYGDVLETYIHTDVILANLLDRLEQKPALFFLADSKLLPALEKLDRTVVCLADTHGAPLKEQGTFQDVSDNEFLVQIAASSGPTRVKVGGQRAGATSKPEIAAFIAQIAHSMDVREPLQRVEAAIRLLWEETPETPPASEKEE